MRARPRRFDVLDISQRKTLGAGLASARTSSSFEPGHTTMHHAARLFAGLVLAALGGACTLQAPPPGDDANELEQPPPTNIDPEPDVPCGDGSAAAGSLDPLDLASDPRLNQTSFGDGFGWVKLILPTGAAE